MADYGERWEDSRWEVGGFATKVRCVEVGNEK